MHRECEGWSRRLPRRPGREGTERAVRTSRAYVHLAGWAGVHGPLSHRKPYFAGDGGNPLHHRTVRIVARQPRHALVIDWPRRWRCACGRRAGRRFTGRRHGRHGYRLGPRRRLARCFIGRSRNPCHVRFFAPDLHQALPGRVERLRPSVRCAWTASI